MKKGRFSLLILLSIIFTLMFSSVSFAVPPEDVETDHLSSGSSSEEDYSFYKMSSAASMFYGAAASPGQSLKWGDWENANGGLGAGFMGFSDANKTKGVVGMWQSFTSTSSASVSYDALVLNPKVNVAYYAYYGAALKNLGVDNTIETTGLAKIVRLFAGLLLILVYIVAMVPGLIFDLAIKLLKYLNIFSWASAGIQATVGSAYADAVKTDPNSALATVGDFVSKTYEALYNFAMDYTFPILVLFGLFALIFKSVIFGQGSKAGWWPWMKKTFIRFIFIGWGFAIMGFLVTRSYDFAQNVAQYQPSAGIIKSHFVDFEAWFTSSGLALPGDTGVPGEDSNHSKIIYDVRSGQVIGDIGRDVPDFVDKINENSVVFSPDKNSRVIKDWNAWAFGALIRYMTSETYKPSDFESYIKATLLKKYGSSGLDTFKAQFENADEPKDFESLKSTGSYLTKSNYSVFFVNNGSGIEGSWDSKGLKRILTLRTPGSPTSAGSLDNPNNNRPMSYMGLYNYLCTDFSADKMLIYSQEKSSSDYVKMSHASVNLAGQGFMPILYWIQMFVQLLFLAIIGIGYALGMFFSVFKRQLSAFIALPFAMIGFMGMIAKVIGAGILCVVELIATMILYNLFSILITNLSTVLLNIIGGVVTVGAVGGVAAGMMVGSVTFPFVVPLIVCIFIIIFNLKMMFISLSLRRKFIDAVDELLMKLVDKILLMDVNATGGGASLLMADSGARSGSLGGLVRGAAGNVVAGYGMYQVMNGTKNALNGNPLGSVASGGGTKEPEKPLNSETNVNYDGDVNNNALPNGGDPNNLPDNGGGGNAMIPEVPVLPDNSPDGGNAMPITNGEIDSEGVAIKQAGENVLEKNSLSDSKDESKNESRTAVEAKTGDAVKDVASGNASASGAVTDAKVSERASEIKADAKKAKAMAGAQAVVGGVKATGGAYTGNAALAADGAKDVAKAAGTLKSAGNVAKNADAQAKAEVKNGAVVQNSVSKEAGKSLIESGKSLATAGAGSVASGASNVSSAGNAGKAVSGLKSAGGTNITEGAKTVQGNTTNVSSALNRNSTTAKSEARVQSGNTNVSAKNNSKATVSNTANVNASKSTKTVEGKTENVIKPNDMKSSLKASTLQKAVTVAKTVDQKLDSEVVRNIHRGERIVEIGKSIKPEKKVVKKTSEFEKNLQHLTKVQDSEMPKKTPRKK